VVGIAEAPAAGVDKATACGVKDAAESRPGVEAMAAVEGELVSQKI
jgi:hypothetical protein